MIAFEAGHELAEAERIAFASVIARSLPSAICRGRWLNPQELVMIVCSGESQRCILMRSATCAPVSTFGAWTSTAPTPSLFFTEVALIMRRHVVFDQITVAGNPAHEVGLVAPLVKITMTDLPIVVRANGLIALTYVHHDMHVIWKALDGGVDGIDGSTHFVVCRHREIRLVNLNMLAACFREVFQVLMQ